MVLAWINLLLYAYVVALAVKFFHPNPDSRRDSDKAIVAGIGMISALLVFVLVSVLVTYPDMGSHGRGAVSMLYLFCTANASLYLAIIKAVSRVADAPDTRKKRYFP